MRTLATVIINIAIILGWVGTLAAVVWADNALFRGITFQANPTSMQWAGGPLLGVNAYNIQFEPDPAEVTKTLELAKQLGAQYVRIQMPWEDVEIHGRGDFEDRRNPQQVRNAWEKYDQLFAEMQRLGLEPIVRIDRSPAWSRPQALATEAWRLGLARNGASTGPPDDYADYARFVGTVAARYRGVVQFYQIWNEPNLAYEWNWQPPNPLQFVDLLQQSAQAIRQANPQAVILFPSLSPTDGLEPSAANELEYLDQVYQAGAANAFDIMSAQAYGLGQPPDEHRYVFPRRPGNWNWLRPIDTRIDVSRVVLLREVMEHHGDQHKAIWISEFGYVAASDQIPAERQNLWGPPVSETQKAEYLVGQLERARREWPWIGVMNVWFLRWGGYQPPDPADPTQFFAIASRDYQRLPAYQALQQWSQTGPVASVGTHAWTHPAVQQREPGVWEIPFRGHQLILTKLTSQTTVSLNGAPPQSFEAGTTEAILTISDQTQLQRVEIRAASPPQTFRITRQPDYPWLPWAVAGAIIGLCGTTTWLASRGITTRH